MLVTSEVSRCCRIATTVVATVFGVERRPLSGLGQQTAGAIFARQVAMYLVHVGFGVPMTHVAQSFRRSRTTVTHACHTIEDGRDDSRFDALLDHMEAAAVSLRSAHSLWLDR